MTQVLIERLRGAATQLPLIESNSFGSYFDSFDGSRIVLIGDGR